MQVCASTCNNEYCRVMRTFVLFHIMSFTSRCEILFDDIVLFLRKLAISECVELSQLGIIHCSALLHFDIDQMMFNRFENKIFFLFKDGNLLTKTTSQIRATKAEKFAPLHGKCISSVYNKAYQRLERV